jgi:hypothetical protein
VRVLHALAIHNASGAPVACSVKSNTTIRGEWTLADDQSIVLPFAAEGWCASAAGQSLEFVAAAGVTGIATYSTQTL